MINPTNLMLGLWVLFYTYWFISAIGVKKNIRTRVWWQRSGFRIFILIFVVMLLTRSARPILHRYALIHLSPTIQYVGVLVCALGLAFAVWARLHLGRNWGQPMTLKEGHELVTSGPYQYVRHPIYSGILLGIAGSSLVAGLQWLLLLVLVGAFLVHSARTEERIMAQQFPNEYPSYRSKTKMLVPFVW